MTGLPVTGTRKVSSGAVWEPAVGYSRAVAAGDYIFVSGCTSIDGAEFVHPGDAFAQTTQAIANIAAALEQLGASLADVVRTRIYVTDIARWEDYGRAHGAAFGQVRPAATMIGVAALIDPRMLVEVEATAYQPGAGTGGTGTGGTGTGGTGTGGTGTGGTGTIVTGTGAGAAAL